MDERKPRMYNEEGTAILPWQEVSVSKLQEHIDNRTGKRTMRWARLEDHGERAYAIEHYLSTGKMFPEYCFIPFTIIPDDDMKEYSNLFKKNKARSLK